MFQISHISLSHEEDRLTIRSAKRIESLGCRLRWELTITTSGVAEMVKNWAVDPTFLRPTLVAGPLLIIDADGKETSFSGPFRIIGLSEHSEPVLIVEQTFEASEALNPIWYAQELADGNIKGWINACPISNHLDPVQEDIRNSLQNILGGARSVVMCLGQTPVDLAAWLAWTATAASSQDDRPFWILGGSDKTWRLVRDDNQRVLEVGPTWKLSWSEATRLDSTYVRVPGPLRRYRFRCEDEACGLASLENDGFLPHRVNVDGNHLRVVSRIDSFGTGPVGWQVELQCAEQCPLPRWDSPTLEPTGRLMGTIAEAWTSGEFVLCRMDRCDSVFPVRLTSFDTGDDQLTGWQWVPTAGNRVRLDPDWSLTGIPSLMYAERMDPVEDPYTFAIPSDASWIGRFGSRVMRFLKEGLHIE